MRERKNDEKSQLSEDLNLLRVQTHGDTPVPRQIHFWGTISSANIMSRQIAFSIVLLLIYLHTKYEQELVKNQMGQNPIGIWLRLNNQAWLFNYRMLVSRQIHFWVTISSANRMSRQKALLVIYLLKYLENGCSMLLDFTFTDKRSFLVKYIFE